MGGGAGKGIRTETAKSRQRRQKTPAKRRRLGEDSGGRQGRQRPAKESEAPARTAEVPARAAEATRTAQLRRKGRRPGGGGRNYKAVHPPAKTTLPRQRRPSATGKSGPAPAKAAQRHRQKRGRPANRQVCLNRSARRSYPFTRAWSARNWARPLSVSGCLSSPLMAASGQVATSAPASRQRMMWFVWRIEAASTCV